LKKEKEESRKPRKIVASLVRNTSQCLPGSAKGTRGECEAQKDSLMETTRCRLRGGEKVINIVRVTFQEVAEQADSGKRDTSKKDSRGEGKFSRKGESIMENQRIEEKKKSNLELHSTKREHEKSKKKAETLLTESNGKRAGERANQSVVYT